MNLPGFLRETTEGTELRLKVQPRASRDEMGPPEGDELKVRVTAPPVDSAANEAVCRVLAGSLECRRGDVRIIRGLSSRHKTVQVCGMNPADVLSRLRADDSSR